MNTEAKEHYRGVLCTHCRQPIPLSPSAARQDARFGGEQLSAVDQFVVRVFTLRCRVCHGEGHYTPLSVVDCEGTPRTRGAQARKSLLKPGPSGASRAANA